MHFHQLRFDNNPLPPLLARCVASVQAVADEHTLHRLPPPEGDLCAWSDYHRMMILLADPAGVWCDTDVEWHKSFDFQPGVMYCDFRNGEPHGSILTFGGNREAIEGCLRDAVRREIKAGTRAFHTRLIRHLPFVEIPTEYYTHHYYTMRGPHGLGDAKN